MSCGAVFVSGSSSRSGDTFEGELHRALRLRNGLRRRDRKSPFDVCRLDHAACGVRWILRELDGPPYDGFQSPAAGPASGRVSPEFHDAIATISAWS